LLLVGSFQPTLWSGSDGGLALCGSIRTACHQPPSTEAGRVVSTLASYYSTKQSSNSTPGTNVAIFATPKLQEKKGRQAPERLESIILNHM